MALNVNSTKVKNIYVNGTKVKKAYVNGTQVYNSEFAIVRNGVYVDTSLGCYAMYYDSDVPYARNPSEIAGSGYRQYQQGTNSGGSSVRTGRIDLTDYSTLVLDAAFTVAANSWPIRLKIYRPSESPTYVNVNPSFCVYHQTAGRNTYTYDISSITGNCIISFETFTSGAYWYLYLYNLYLM